MGLSCVEPSLEVFGALCRAPMHSGAGVQDQRSPEKMIEPIGSRCPIPSPKWDSLKETTTVRDSVFALLADHTIPASGFIHLYDTTPYSVKNGHVAAKIPCDDESTPLLDILVGVAPDLTPAPLELNANLSTAGELCLYHTDLPAPDQANTTTTSANATTTNATMITDIAISNPGDEDVTLPSTSTVVIGINEIARGEHSHEEEQPQDGAL